jgi:hypothetical protein
MGNSMNDEIEFVDILKHPPNRNIHENKKKKTLERLMPSEFHNSFGIWIAYELLDISLRYKKNLVEKRFTPELYQKMLDSKINEFLNDYNNVKRIADEMGLFLNDEDLENTAKEFRAFGYRIADLFTTKYIEFYSPSTYDELLEVTNKASIEINRIIVHYKKRLWEVWVQSGNEKKAIAEGIRMMEEDLAKKKVSEFELEAMKDLLIREFEKVKKFYADNRLHIKVAAKS